jgi:alpha-beta hydrolase superfamily lysophospholipase
MSYSYSEIKFPSKDGINTINAGIYEPRNTEIRAVIQVSHGMVDHIGRYKNLAEFFCKKGYVVAGNDHLGHGKSVKSEEDFGYFAKKDGVSLVLRDIHSFNKILRERYIGVPIILFGHSMGSFLARLYTVKYSHTVSAVIIHGTAGKNSLVGMGKLLAKIISAIKGERHRSKLLKSMSTGSYNNHFSKSEGEHAWLTRDLNEVSDRSTDPATSYIFTASAYRDLFTMLSECNKNAWFDAYPKAMPTLIVSGEADPVGDFGRGVNFVYSKLLLSGASNLKMRLYADARHELFNEFNRESIFCDILAFTEGVINK